MNSIKSVVCFRITRSVREIFEYVEELAHDGKFFFMIDNDNRDRCLGEIICLVN